MRLFVVINFLRPSTICSAQGASVPTSHNTATSFLARLTEEFLAGKQSTVPTYGLQGQQVAREPTDKRPGGAVKDPMATRNCPVELCGSASPATA